MKRILFSWEMGVGLGHVSTLCAIADRFVEAGTHCTFALPDPLALQRLRPGWNNRSNVTIAHFPGWQPIQPKESLQRTTRSFIDILDISGFADHDVLQQHTQWWARLFAEARPDLIVAEFAPGCTWYAFGRIPIVTVGNGYSVLPDYSPLPELASWASEAAAPTNEIESRILDAINVVRESLKLPCFDKVSSAFRGNQNYPCTYRSLDPYRAVRSEPVYLPLALPVSGTDASHVQQWQANQSHSTGFVYYSIQHPTFHWMLQQVLRQTKFPCAIYAPEMLAAKLREPRIVGPHLLLDRPLDLSLLSTFAFCIHPGGLGLAAAAASARVPQLLTPVSLEALSTGIGLQKQQAAIVGLPHQVESLTTPGKLEHIIGETIRLSMQLDPEFHDAQTTSSNVLRSIHQTMDAFLIRG